MIHVRHETASGRLDEGWSFDRLQRRILARVRMAANVVEIDVPVCSLERPVLGAHPIHRLGEETWIIIPQCFVYAFPNRVRTLVPLNCPVGDLLPPGQQVLLSNAPPTVSVELEAL